MLTKHPVSIERQRSRDAHCEVEYKRYKFWRALLFLSMLLFSILVLGSVFLFHSSGQVFLFIWAFAVISWMAAALAAFRLNRWLCPNCGEIFSSARWYSLGPFALHCVHCGFPKQPEA